MAILGKFLRYTCGYGYVLSTVCNTTQSGIISAMKRFTPLLGVILLLPSIALGASLSVTVDGKATALTDVSSTAWYASHVKILAEAGIMQGYRDNIGRTTGKFGPTNPVTRAEFLKMVAVMMVYRYDFDRSSVLSGEQWYKKYLQVVESKDPQLSSVMPIDEVSLHQPILRHEAAGLIHLGLGNYGNPKTWDLYPLFSDMTRDTPNAFAIAEMKYYGVLSGDGKTGKFNPFRTLNRAEAAKMLVTTSNAYQTPLGIPTTGNPIFDSREGCEAAGGTWKRWGTQLPWDTCNFPTTDGRKQCTGAFDCQGDCITHDPNASSGMCSDWKQVYDNCIYYLREGKTFRSDCYLQ